MRFCVFFCLMACSGCPPQPIPTKLDATAPPMVDLKTTNEYGLIACPAVPSISFADICDGMFTSAGLSCVHCPDMSACLDTLDVIYCAAGGPGCLGDPNCVHVQDGEDGGPASAKLKRKLRMKTKRQP